MTRNLIKVRVLILIAILGGVILLTADSLATKKISNLPVKYIEPMYAADFSNDRVLVGASTNVFIGTVLTQSGSKERGIGPETQFSVQVTQNIKGALKGVVTVDQEGGIKGGVLYVVGDDNVLNGQEPQSYLLHPGSTYVFATRYNEAENWYTLNPYPTALTLIATATSTAQTLFPLIANDTRVRQLEAAYPEEILLRADVANKNTLNSYASKQHGLASSTIIDSASSTNDSSM